MRLSGGLSEGWGTCMQISCHLNKPRTHLLSPGDRGRNVKQGAMCGLMLKVLWWSGPVNHCSMDEEKHTKRLFSRKSSACRPLMWAKQRALSSISHLDSKVNTIECIVMKSDVASSVPFQGQWSTVIPEIPVTSRGPQMANCKRVCPVEPASFSVVNYTSDPILLLGFSVFIMPWVCYT